MYRIMVVLELIELRPRWPTPSRGDFMENSPRLFARLAVLLFVSVVVAFAPSVLRVSLSAVYVLVARCVEWWTRPAIGPTDVEAVQDSWWWNQLRVNAVHVPGEWDHVHGVLGRLLRRMSEAGWTGLAQWAALVILAMVISFGTALSLGYRRYLLNTSEGSARLPFRSIPSARGMFRLLGPALILVLALSSAWILVAMVLGYLQIVLSAWRWCTVLLMRFSYWWSTTHDAALAVTGFVGVLWAGVTVSRYAITGARRERRRVCRRCAYPSVARSGVCPECGAGAPKHARPRFFPPRVRGTLDRLFRRTIILVVILTFVNSPCTMLLAKVRYSEWWLRTIDGATDAQVELARLRYKHTSVVLVSTTVPYRLRYTGGDQVVEFHHEPLQSVTCLVRMSNTEPVEHTFDISPLRLHTDRPLPLVRLNGVDLLLTPREDYGLPDDLPPGWIAVRVYGHARFEPLDSEESQAQ